MPDFQLHKTRKPMSITKTIENGHTSWHPNIRSVRDQVYKYI